MTAAQRQKRRRARLKREASAGITSAKRAKAKAKAHATYIPMPPGITYWEKVRVQTAEGEREVHTPKSRPLAACHSDLTDDDVLQLMAQLRGLADKRGLI